MQQNGFDPIDAFCDINLQYRMAKAVLTFKTRKVGHGCRLCALRRGQRCPRGPRFCVAASRRAIDRIDDMVKAMVDEIEATVEEN